MSKSGDFQKCSRAFLLVLQLGIAVMVPTFLCLGLGIWLDHVLHSTWIAIALLIVGILAGGRSAYRLARGQVPRNTRKMDEQYDLMAGWDDLTDDSNPTEQEEL